MSNSKKLPTELVSISSDHVVDPLEVEVYDPNKIVEATFTQVKTLTPEVLEKLGEITISVSYQLLPSCIVTLKK